MRSEFYISFVKHIRFFPKKYEFDYRFFWTRFDLDELEELGQKTRFFSRNSFNLISFYDRDHIYLGYESTKENIKAFLREQGITDEITKIELVTNPRVLGYTFNPVSFFFIQTSKTEYMVIEVGNTFKEQKPFLVLPSFKVDGEWIFKTKKNFYVSPFTSVENEMIFRIKRNEKSLVINIDDFDSRGELEVKAIFSGTSLEWTEKNVLKLFFAYPLITFRIIASIHYHALKLYLKKVPFWKKSDNDDLQTDHYSWDDKAYRKKIKAS